MPKISGEQVSACSDLSCLYNHTLGMCETCGKTIQEMDEFPTAGQDRRKQIARFAKLRLKDYRNR